MLVIVGARVLFNNLSNNTSTYCSTTFTNSEFKTFFHRDWANQINNTNT